MARIKIKLGKSRQRNLVQKEMDRRGWPKAGTHNDQRKDNRRARRKARKSLRRGEEP